MARPALGLEERLLKRRKIVPGPEHTPCWIWTGYVTPVRRPGTDGYGQIKINNKSYFVHRVAYALWVGPLIEGLEIDHRCAVRHCFNPEHLEQVTHKENVLRGHAGWALAQKTICIRGHKYDAQNTYWKSNGTRDCRVCRNLRGELRRANEKQIYMRLRRAA